MSRPLRTLLWLILPVLIIAGLLRLRLDVEVLNLLPPDVPAVQGLKIYQQQFANARELILTVRGTDPEQTEEATRSLAERLRSMTNDVSTVTWQPPWLENPAQSAEFLAYLWFNQPPAVFNQLLTRLAETNLPALLSTAREQLASSMSPGDVAQLSYDPFELTQLPNELRSAAPGFASGNELFASADGTFRIVFVKASSELNSYRECHDWLARIKQAEQDWRTTENIPASMVIHYTGRPAFVSEIAGGMEKDMRESVIGTAVIISILFWLAHRRLKPMLWLLALLAGVLLSTLAFGGLIFGTINVVSMGFAAILLGLAVDYAVVHYQEALAHPGLSIPEIRRAIAPSIFWAATTTVAAFLVLNLGGLPGLAQLGSLVAIGVAMSAVVMIFAYLPPLFPNRRKAGSGTFSRSDSLPETQPLKHWHRLTVSGATAAMIAGFGAFLSTGLPTMDSTSNALRPRNSSAYATLDEVKTQLGQKEEPLWVLLGGQSELEVAQRLQTIKPLLENAVSNQTVSGMTLPDALWPQPEHQNANRETARTLVAKRTLLRDATLAEGFSEVAFGLASGMLDTWQRAAATSDVFWPTNDMSRWVLEKLTARNGTNLFAVGFLYPGQSIDMQTNERLEQLGAAVNRNGIWLSGWQLLGHEILKSVRANLWKLVLPMIALILVSLWVAFKRVPEVLLSLAILSLSGLGLLTVMRLADWSWNLLNLMALPLILGTGVDYSIFMQLALRRHHGDIKLTHRSVGRALFLCGGTAIAGFGSLAFSSNAGMAGLGQVCAVGIAFNVLISVLLLPVWWRSFAQQQTVSGKGEKQPELSAPSSLYRAEFWRMGLWVVRLIPRSLCIAAGRFFASIYWVVARERREVVIENLLPALNGDRALATRKAKALFREFATKVVDLWQYETGMPVERLLGEASGWEHYKEAQATGRGILLLTPHLGNWEFGGPWMTRQGVTLVVITHAEPGKKFTELRQASRSRWNIETVVVGNDPFSFVEIIKRLEAGATVALLVDRPSPQTAVQVELFGRSFDASVAAAELARASGCILLPVYIPHSNKAYAAHILPPIPYERAALRDRENRQKLTQQIMRTFEPAIRTHIEQWFQFIPIWPPQK